VAGVKQYYECHSGLNCSFTVAKGHAFSVNIANRATHSAMIFENEASIKLLIAAWGLL
jgi:hypothetical protein